MYQGYRFSFGRALWWTRHSISFVTVYSSIVAAIAYFSAWKWFARGIEIDIRQMLGETDLPPKIGVVEGTDVMI